MPSRRHIIAASGIAVTTGSFGGCLSKRKQTKTGNFQLKAISLEWKDGNQRYKDQPLWILFKHDEQTITGRYDPNIVGGSVRSPDDVVVSKDRHRKLSSRFTVEYVLGMCGKGFDGGNESDGCLDASTSRTDFNRVQLNDEAEVRVADNRFHVVGVHEDAYTVQSTDVHAFDFEKRHEDDGIPTDDW